MKLTRQGHGRWNEGHEKHEGHRRAVTSNLVNLGLKKIAVLFAIAAVTSGCTEKDDKIAIQTVGPRSGPAMQQYANSSGLSLAGRVGASDSEQEVFNDAVRGFMNASIPEEYVGYVSATGRNNTGVFFGGRVFFATGGGLRATSGARMDIASNSQLLVVVYDAFPNQSNIDPLPAVYLVTGSGYVSGNVARLRFEDNDGFVELEGQFDQSTFRGTMSYSNYRRYNSNEPGGQGGLGSFEIPTCQFFQCN